MAWEKVIIKVIKKLQPLLPALKLDFGFYEETQGIKIVPSSEKAMKDKSALDQINAEEKVNPVISQDEDSAVKDTSMALEMAEALILQLPEGHEGRNEWLTRFGQSGESRNLRRPQKNS